MAHKPNPGYAALQKLKQGDVTDEAKAAFDAHKQDLGYGLMLKQFTANVTDATPIRSPRPRREQSRRWRPCSSRSA
jgi:hypothetical protein